MGSAVTEQDKIDIIDGVWDELTSEHVTAGSTGEAIVNGGTGLTASQMRDALGLAAANLDTQLADIPTVAEFEARTIIADNYFDSSVDRVILANSTLHGGGSARIQLDQLTVASTMDVATFVVANNNIPWPVQWDAPVQSGVADALGIYGGPTLAQIEARTLPSGEYFNAAVDNVMLVTPPLTSGQTADAVWNKVLP